MSEIAISKECYARLVIPMLQGFKAQLDDRIFAGYIRAAIVRAEIIAAGGKHPTRRWPKGG